MPYFRSILLALDGSAPARAALDVACALARERGGRITVVTVRGTEPEERRAALALVRDAAEHAQRDYGLELESQILDGDPLTEILAAATVCGADSIVLGSHGRSGVARALLGSVAEGVMRRSTVPVVVVRGARSEQAPGVEQERDRAVVHELDRHRRAEAPGRDR